MTRTVVGDASAFQNATCHRKGSILVPGQLAINPHWQPSLRGHAETPTVGSAISCGTEGTASTTMAGYGKNGETTRP